MAGLSFAYDVFLSHSSKDKPVVRDLAARLQQDGIRVWFDEEQIKPGDSVPAKIEEGLEQSRVLVLCMSANAFGSDWALLEAGTFRFRDPLNKERRFIPLRLDDAPIKGALAQFLYINWCPQNGEQAYSSLLESCRPPENHPKISSPHLTGRLSNIEKTETQESKADEAVQKNLPPGLKLLQTLRGHRDCIYRIAWSPDGRFLVSPSSDGTIRLWDTDTWACLHKLARHTDAVNVVAFDSACKRLVSGSKDTSIRIWEIESGTCVDDIRVGHWVDGIAFNNSADSLITASGDGKVRRWNLTSKQSVDLMSGQQAIGNAITFHPSGKTFASTDQHGIVNLIEITSGKPVARFEGHHGSVYAIAFDQNSGTVATAGSEHNQIMG